MERQIDFIGVPINLGCDRSGVEETPDYIRRSWLPHRPFIFDLGNVMCPKRHDILDEKHKGHSNIKFFHHILKTTEEVSHKVRESINNRHFPLIVGGDHVLSYGSIAGIAQAVGIDKYAVIYIDAHGDFNTEKTSTSGNMHGMHLSFLMGFGDRKASNHFGITPLLRHDNIYFIGSRALDPGEISLAKRLDLSITTSKDVMENNIKDILKPILENIKFKGINHIHISFDIDVIDPQFAPGTGVKEKYGITPNKAIEIISEIMSSGLVKSADVVELNRILDENEQTTSIIHEILDILTYNENSNS